MASRRSKRSTSAISGSSTAIAFTLEPTPHSVVRPLSQMVPCPPFTSRCTQQKSWCSRPSTIAVLCDAADRYQ